MHHDCFLTSHVDSLHQVHGLYLFCLTDLILEESVKDKK